MRATFALLAMILASASASVCRAETILAADRAWGEEKGWTVYWNAENEGCFAEQLQAGGTMVLLGMFGKNNELAIGFRNDRIGFAEKDKSHKLKFRFDGRASWDSGMKLFDPGSGPLLLGVYGGAAKFRSDFAKSGELTIHFGKKSLATISLKGTSAAFKAVDDCRKAKGTGSGTPEVAGKADRAAVAEAAKLESDGLALYDAGNYAEAEPLFRRVLQIREKAFGPEHPAVAAILANLAIVLHRQGDLDGAELLYSRALEIDTKALGSEHVVVAGDIDNLAGLYQDKGKGLMWVESGYRQALAIREKALGRDHLDVALSLTNLATVSSLDEAEPLQRRALEIQERVLGLEHPDVATSLNNLASLLRRTGDLAGAESLHRRALAIREKVFGPKHPDVARSLNNLAFILHEKGDSIGSLALARRAAKVGHLDRGSYLSALFATGAGRFAATTESFEALQQTVASEAGAALRSLALRASVGGGALAGLVRKEQDLAGELANLEGAILAELSKEPSRRSKSKEEKIRDRTAEVTAELSEIREKLVREFPGYAELSQPTALSLADVRQLLASDEALIVIDIANSGEGDDYVWAVTRDAAEWKRIDTRPGEVFVSIARLHTYLDLEAYRDLDRTARAPVHPAWPHFLYKQLLGPVESMIVGKSHLIFVLSGAVSSLPPQVLVNKPPVSDDYRNAAWLIRDYAITVLPTVSSLKLLRSGANIEKAAKPFIGFGDPVWNSEEACGGERRVAALDGRGLVRNGVTDIAALRGAPRLCGTGPELNAVAKSLGAAQEDVVLREGASEAAVKRAALSDYNIVYFATHGLVAGEMEAFNKEKAEPALALTAPEKATDEDDGLLTASEVAQLKLNADWVVLSACNTAAEGKPGAPALSGLARAFFYAGARSLLVSHWYVDDEATAALMSRTFAAAAAHPERRQAEALREAMLSVMNDPKHPEWADPGYWAPFVLVGEARR